MAGFFIAAARNSDRCENGSVEPFCSMAFEFKLPKRLPSWLQDVHTHGEEIEVHLDADLGEDATFSVASTKKELKELKKSDADIVYDERKGKLYLNGNGEGKGWGSKAIGGLIAKVKGKPQISADDVTGFDRYVDQEGLAEFRQLREGIDPAVEADLFVQATLDPEAGIKEIKKYARQEHGMKLSTREIGDYLFEMEANAEFIDVELDAVAIQTLFEEVGSNNRRNGDCCQEEAHNEPWGRCPGMRPMRKWLFGNRIK